MDTSALQHPTAQQSVVLCILYQGIAASLSRNVMDNSGLQRPTALQSTVLHILRQDTRLHVLGRGLVCKRYPSSPLRRLLFLQFSLLLLPPHNPILFNQLQLVRHNG